MLDVVGEDFTSVDEVLVNDLPADTVVVLTQTRLLASLPTPLKPEDVMSVAVLSRQLTITPRSLIKLRVGKTPSMVTGILKLVQEFLRLLFMTPGSDIFSPDLGGAALRNIGSTFSANKGGSVVSDFVLSVNTTSKQLVAIQSRDPRLPKDERLLSARVNSASFDQTTAALIVSVEIMSQAGRSVLANVMV